MLTQLTRGVCGANSHAKNRRFLAGFAVFLAAAIFSFSLAGCDNGTSPGPGSGGEDTGGFSVSGSFTKSAAAGGGVVQFDLKSDTAFSPSASVMGRAVTADSYTLSGALQDGDLTIRLKGSYAPNTGNWSASAKSSAVIYTLDGNIDSEGVPRGSSATIAVYNSGNKEWVPYFFAVTEGAVNISGVAEVGETGGAPSFAQGYWHSNKDYGDGEMVSLGVLVSDWKVKVTGTSTSPYGTMPIDYNWTILECTESGNGAYEMIICYPEYVMTKENLVQALAAYLKIDANIIAGIVDVSPDGSLISISDSGGPNGMTTGMYDKLDVFFATGEWEKWAAANNVKPQNLYIKIKASYTRNNTEFNMSFLVLEGEYPDLPWDYTLYFFSLGELKAAEGDLVEMPELEMTFTR